MNEVSNFRPPSDWSSAPPVASERQSTEQQPNSETEHAGAQSPPGANATLDAASRRRIIKNAIASIKQHHFDHVEAREAADALLAQERRAEDDSATSTEEFARLATKQMRTATGSNELVLLYSTHDIPERTPGPPPPAAYRDEMQRINCAFERVEILPHNVGYLKLNAFPDASVCQATATAAMTKLNDADALIFDLRDNRGGFPNMVSLIAAYLFDHPEYMYCPLENTTAESWTRSPVSGNKLTNKPVYILTSSRTISAAEQFTYNLKMLKRATLVGETTAGGGHAANLHSIGDHFYVGTIEVRAINPYAKSDWSDTGIEPDFKVRAADALNAALGLVDKRLHIE
jgi:C-terminal processing protease CtpA/Prc